VPNLNYCTKVEIEIDIKIVFKKLILKVDSYMIIFSLLLMYLL